MEPTHLEWVTLVEEITEPNLENILISVVRIPAIGVLYPEGTPVRVTITVEPIKGFAE